MGLVEGEGLMLLVVQTGSVLISPSLGDTGLKRKRSKHGAKIRFQRKRFNCNPVAAKFGLTILVISLEQN